MELDVRFSGNVDLTVARRARVADDDVGVSLDGDGVADVAAVVVGLVRLLLVQALDDGQRGQEVGRGAIIGRHGRVGQSRVRPHEGQESRLPTPESFSAALLLIG